MTPPAPRPFVAVIMAGGRGQRFWPLSTIERPKQFLDLEQTGRTLIQATYDRLLPLAGSPEGIYVATGRRYLDLVREQLPSLPEANVLVEPEGRDSAPAVALASLVIHERTGGATLGFFSSDHRIGDEAAFGGAVHTAISVAEGEHGLVTLGITPTHPATGYGYVERGEATGPAYRVLRFVEKPTAARARQYLAAGTFAWNAGIFVWRSDVILAELDRHAPEIMQPLRAALRDGTLDEVFPGLPKTSIDYAVMERTDRAFVVPVDCDWDDLGDWLALERLLGRNGDAPDAVVGQHVAFEAHGNIIYTDSEEDVVVTVGVHDLIVVKHGSTVLLMAKERAADIKKVLEDDRLGGDA
jgi:mannose-1-phosphate guanylyltransferase